VADDLAVLGSAQIAPIAMEDWASLLMTNTDRSYKGNLANAMVVFRHAPPWARKIGHDLRSGRLIALAETPACVRGPWTDACTAVACEWLQRAHIPVKLGDVATAIEAVAMQVPVDPLGEWLLGLPARWDGQDRLGAWLSTYCGAAQDQTSSMIGSKFLIGAVARALQPGCRMDNMLVLEGAQGIGKSTVVRVLGGEWAGENLPDFSSRDAMQIAGNRWIIEVGELAAMRRSDLEEVKSFLTRTEDTYVPKYARHPITRKRCSVLVGNINPGENGYLIDPTGNRRFWPVTVGVMDIAALKRDREQLFGEAAYCYQRGDPWWVENAEQQTIFATAQELRLEHDEWEQIIARFVVEEPVAQFDGSKSWLPRSHTLGQTTVAEIATQAIGMPAKDLNKSAQMRIATALKNLGFVRKKARVDGQPRWVFQRASEEVGHE
jgi:predicted P-loop ATPase